MRHNIPHIEPKLLFHKKDFLSENEMIEINVWKVDKSEKYPEGITYSMVYLRAEREKYRRVLGYDNKEGKGHHKHFLDKEEELVYISWKELVKRFESNVNEIKRCE